MIAALAAYGVAPSAREAESWRAACAGDARCVAELLIAARPGRARLAVPATPDSDTIRWVATRPSVATAARAADGRLRIALTRFGREVEPELRAALADPDAARVELDLRDNAGGDFGRMLRVAGLLLGPRAAALTLVGPQGEQAVALPAVAPAALAAPLVVRVGPRTASSAEVLAALLRRYGEAEIVGRHTAGKDHLTRVVPVDQRTRLLIAAERVVVPGETLAGGLRPDRVEAAP
jgi:C-terminal processing protease CtpA/Prc